MRKVWYNKNVIEVNLSRNTLIYKIFVKLVINPSSGIYWGLYFINFRENPQLYWGKQKTYSFGQRDKKYPPSTWYNI